MQIDDAIAALASAPGSAGRGVIRICGGDLQELIRTSFQSGGRKPLDYGVNDRCEHNRGTHIPRSEITGARRMTGWWRVGDSAARIPCDLWHWPDHRCYAGQPTAELHLPGSPPLMEKVLEDLYRRNVRPARPGEFTLRAFLAGKIDLVQAEAVLGVIDAESEGELRTALSQLAGGISQRVVQLRHDLVDLLADLEAGLDFVEEDITFVTRDEILARLSDSTGFVQQLISQTDSRMTSATRKKVVLAGLPNAGKSTLFNRLANRELALVSPIEGTTTDFVRAEIQLHGVDIELIDTAGWEQKIAGIPAAAQRQRTEQLDRADLILWCAAHDMDGTQHEVDRACCEPLRGSAAPIVLVTTKSDLPSGGCQPPDCGIHGEGERNQGAHVPRSECVFVSAHTGDGIDALTEIISRHLTTSHSSAWLGTTSARCRDSLQHALAALASAEDAASSPGIGDELLSVDLRVALDHLGEVVGAVYTDDLLDRIFSKFCIGK